MGYAVANQVQWYNQNKTQQNYVYILRDIL